MGACFEPLSMSPSPQLRKTIRDFHPSLLVNTRSILYISSIEAFSSHSIKTMLRTSTASSKCNAHLPSTLAQHAATRFQQIPPSSNYHQQTCHATDFRHESSETKRYTKTSACPRIMLALVQFTKTLRLLTFQTLEYTVYSPRIFERVHIGMCMRPGPQTRIPRRLSTLFAYSAVIWGGEWRKKKKEGGEKYQRKNLTGIQVPISGLYLSYTYSFRTFVELGINCQHSVSVNHFNHRSRLYEL